MPNWVMNQLTCIFQTSEEYNAFKEKYVKKERETLLSEDLVIEIPSSKFTNLETINK